MVEYHTAARMTLSGHRTHRPDGVCPNLNECYGDVTPTIRSDLHRHPRIPVFCVSRTGATVSRGENGLKCGRRWRIDQSFPVAIGLLAPHDDVFGFDGLGLALLVIDR